MPRIFKTLDLATVHLPHRILASDGEDITACHPLSYGLFLWVPPDAGSFDPDPDGTGEATGDNDPVVRRIRAYARELGCDYVMFDVDADEDQRLPTFDDDAEVPAADIDPFMPVMPSKIQTCGRCGQEFPTGAECAGPGYHP